MDLSEADKYDFDGSLDLSEADKYDFDGSLDLSESDKYDFDGSLDLSEADKYDFDGSLDFSEMGKNDEENELGPTEESNNSQETDEGGDTNNSSDSSSDSSEQGNESYENLSSESLSTVLVSENIQNGDQDGEEIDQEELEREIEKELEEGVKGINKYLEEEAEFINAYQEMVGKERALDEERESEGEGRQKTDEEWEKEVETAAYTAEQLYESTEEIETNTINEEISEIKEELEIEKEAEQSEEISEPQLSDLKEETSELYEDLEKERDEIEQHQVESAIQEELDTEAEPIVNEKEVENLQELDIEEQFQTVHLNEFIDELVEKQNEENEQLKEQVEKEELEAQANELKEANSELYEDLEKDRDEIEHHQVESAIQEELETEAEPIVNEKEVENLQELDIEEQFQAVHLNEFIDELVERQDEEDKNNESDKKEQEKENIEQSQEVIHQSTYLQEKLEEQEQVLELDYEEKDEVEQHQVEAEIEEELKTEPKPIINEEELEYIKVLEPEKQLEAELFYEFIEELANKQNEEKEEREENEEQEDISTEQKVARIMCKLDIPQEINTGETEVENNSQEGELMQETTSPDEVVVEQLEIEENKDHEQELEEILEQVRKIEQEALNEIEQEEEDLEKTIEKNYERVKKLYKQQTGKRPIYANKETKGFKQWLEQKKKSEDREKTKQKKGLKEEQKKEETWKWFLKNWIGRATEIDPELKSELKKLVEEYDELEKLIKKYSQLYNKAHREKLSQAEKSELKSLIKALQKIDPIKIELFLGIREIKRYLDGQHFFDFWDKPLVNRIRSHFFTLLSQIYKSLKQAQKNKENSEEILKNWIEQASEEEISPELKVKLKEIAENYSELEELATMFMKLYTKEQRENLSKHEKQELKSLIKTLEKRDPINILLFANIRAIKHYLNDQHLDDFSDKARVNRVISKFFKHISQKILKLKELINPNEKLKLKKCQLIDNQECDPSLDLMKQQNSVKNIEVNKNSLKNRYMVQKYKIKFSDEEIEFFKNPRSSQLKKKILKSKTWGSLDSPQTNLDKYFPPEVRKHLIHIVNKVFSRYLTHINENRATLPGYDPKLPILKFIVDLSKLDNKFAHDLISKEGKYKYQWWGFTYEWEDLWTGVIMTGKTTRPHPTRKWEYVLNSINIDPNITSLKFNSKKFFFKHINQSLRFNALNIKDEIKNDITENVIKKIKIQGLIFHHLILRKIITHTITGEIDLDSIDYSAIKNALNDRFKFSILELTFSSDTLSQCEIKRIHKQQRKGVALNRDTKSLGLTSAYNLVIGTVIRLIALGFKRKQIFNILAVRGYKGNYAKFCTLLYDSFDGIRKAQDKFLNPVLNLFFAKDEYMHYLSEVYNYFERGFSSNKISKLCGLDKIFNNSVEVVRRIITKEYSSRYNDCESFIQLRDAVFKDLFLNQIEKNFEEGININYNILLRKFDGFTDNRSEEKFKFRRIQDYFKKVFKGMSLSDVVVNIYHLDGFKLIKSDLYCKRKGKLNSIEKYNKILGLYSKNELYKEALKLIRINIWENKITNYSAKALSIDLNFKMKFGYLDNAFKKSKKLIKKHLKISFEDLIVQALGLRNKAIALVCEHIDKITTTPGRSGYKCIDLLVDLGLNEILSMNSLIHCDRYFNRFIGFSSWQELLNFVKYNYFKDQTFDWEINFQYFFNFYKKNPDKTPEVYLERFPKVNRATIYRWIKKCKHSSV